MIDELRRFLLVAREGNITRTADKIFLTQSALTQSIHRLEKELHTELFIQQGKYLQLTPDGIALVMIGEKIMRLWEDAKSPELRADTRQHISLGLFDNAALRLGKFIQKNINSEKYRIDLTIDASGKLFTLLKLGILDFAVCITSRTELLPNHVSVIDTFNEKLIPVSAKKYSDSITKIPFIFYNSGSHTREQTDEAFRAKNIQPIIFAESTSTTFMKELALLSSGVALLPENFVRAELAQKILVKQKLPISWNREYALYKNKKSPIGKNHPAITELITVLKKSK